MMNPLLSSTKISLFFIVYRKTEKRETTVSLFLMINDIVTLLPHRYLHPLQNTSVRTDTEP